ncbi:MAG TPA: HAD-IA family hydrolase, partial [Planctomycetota bacterium]|nr:HAD-IA family hydrolase [Planctomycetota bacterium]
MDSGMKYDLLVFDLDGTLIDSAPDISASLRRVLVRMGREPISHERVVAAIGSGVRKLVERTTTPPVEPVIDAFMAEYAEHLMDLTRLFPGVPETLSRLPGRKIVLSNKPEKLSRRVVEGLGIGDHFEAVFGGDSFPSRKPDAACFRAAAGAAKSALLIGDSGVDMETARNAGVPS